MNSVDRYSIAKIPGCHVPRHVLRVLSRIYPEVKIVWNYHYERWQMIERDRNGRLSDIALIQGKGGTYATPTMENTVGFLQEIDSIQHMTTKYDLDRFLEKLDSDRAVAKATRELAMRDRVMPVGEAIYDAVKGKVSVAVPGSKRHQRRRSWRHS